ncbi:hypothetical protein AM493_15235 [Flavobacterium akiainvivens]|uniref:Uncharacterized protein n=1 Tax=Flavobacterium akiainvivens TaxID=1202724 RepID=A0A0M8MK86_9FLAO|nr:hypothetical protein [Flavobacterium akiainvivens]KOS07238.1 hypothetical protein AM493_15235 [Flavobacterium akiainvivens]SFQ45458.1 hypothetical protein SAMN05444144_10529 [Flavobacterium akiainvivens]
MKRVLIVIGTIIGILFIAFQAFSAYNASNIMSNQAVFQVYTTIPDEDIDAYFGLQPGTFNPQRQTLACMLPVKTGDFKVGTVPVNINLGGIDCKQEYDKQIHLKYDNTELRSNVFRIMIVQKSMPLVLVERSGIGAGGTVAYKDIPVNFSRGKINNIVFTPEKAYNYCQN